MSERIVYFLGAGFSRPYGLPLVADFLERARDLHAEGVLPEHFEQVFDRIRSAYARVQGTYRSDMRNVEEVLSLREIDVILGLVSSNPVKRFIQDVIVASTPTFHSHDRLFTRMWRKEAFEQPNKLGLLALFAAGIHNLRVEPEEVPGLAAGPAVQGHRYRLRAEVDQSPASRYDIVTTNYDTLLEDASAWLSRTTRLSEVGFRYRVEDDVERPALAKLHGCVRHGDIVPPTWNKSADADILPRWRLAREVLGRANHIRFVGYSLPDTDAYVRYLVKSAAVDSERLKTISVICVQSDDEVAKRFESFVGLPANKYRFFDRTFEASLEAAAIAFHSRDELSPTRALEGAHAELWTAKRGAARVTLT